MITKIPILDHTATHGFVVQYPHSNQGWIDVSDDAAIALKGVSATKSARAAIAKAKGAAQ